MTHPQEQGCDTGLVMSHAKAFCFVQLLQEQGMGVRIALVNRRTTMSTGNPAIAAELTSTVERLLQADSCLLHPTGESRLMSKADKLRNCLAHGEPTT